MSQKAFNNRVYGCTIVKAINANYNADFSHQPRTLPDGTAYATDKAFKYLVRNYWLQNYSGDRDYVLYFKRLNEKMRPYDLNDAYEAKFGKIEKNVEKAEVLKNLMSCIDVRFFGATYANKQAKVSLSLHGPLQISHGVNRFPANDIYSEQIMSPFADQKEGKDAAEATTLGTQHKLAEGHYVHNFSFNPGNLTAHFALKEFAEGAITEKDIDKVKAAMCKGATLYDSSAKAGIENEFLLWVELKEDSKAVLPSFISMVNIDESGIINLESVSQLLNKEHLNAAIQKIELHYDAENTKVINAPDGAKVKPLT